ncbi:MAG: hypothetical protein OHK0022_19970 [Roseiflexaceae bacterium]
MTRLTKEQRRDVNVARKIIEEELLPDPVTRSHCLEIFAKSIAIAKQATPKRWGVTLYPAGEQVVRLTVGMIYVYNIKPGRVALTIDGLSQNPAVIQNYLSPSNFEELRRVSEGKKEPLPNAPQFVSAVDAVWCWFSPDKIHEAFPLIEDAYFSLIRIAATTRLNPAVPKAHSPSVIEYLREQVQGLF